MVTTEAFTDTQAQARDAVSSLKSLLTGEPNLSDLYQARSVMRFIDDSLESMVAQLERQLELAEKEMD